MDDYGYFETIDGSLEEAAALDGATPWQAFRLVLLLPLSVPILAVVFILSFIAAITEVPVASLLLRDVNSYTLAVGMQQYLNPAELFVGRLCRRSCTFSHSDHSGVLAGAALAGQRTDGRWCERLSFTEVTARQRQCHCNPQLMLSQLSDCYSGASTERPFYVNSRRLSDVKRLHSPDYFY